MLHSTDITDYSNVKYPINITDANIWLRDVDEEDTWLINSLIKAATQLSETVANQDFLPRTYEMRLDADSETTAPSPILLDMNPVNTITEVKKYINGSYTTIQNTDYWLKKRKYGTELVLKNTENIDNVHDAIVIKYTTLPDPKNIDQAIQAIKLTVAKWYDNRMDGKQEYPSTAEVMMKNIRIRTI